MSIKKYLITASLLLLSLGYSLDAQVQRAEPSSWWLGMKTNLQVMFYGEDIASSTVSAKGLKITGVHKADSPNYLFVDVEIPADAKPGTYTFKFKGPNGSFTHPYTISERSKDSAARKGYDSSDLIYLIMPDRFANGDLSNDSTADTAEKANRANANGRHGGDIQGIIDHLDYIKSLGATAIWSTPLLLDDEPRVSYHGYACSDYYNIDPRYGTNELYRTLVTESHKRDLKVIMDIVTNHCGTAHWWMKDLPFTDWVNPNGRSRGSMSAYMDPNGAQVDQDEFSRVWFAASMPDMNMQNPYLLKYFTQWAIWWIEYAGLDGFRVDTFPYNDKETMSLWCAAVMNEYPSFSIVGECWMGSPAQVSYWDGRKTNFDGYSSHLTSVMDFPLMNAIISSLRPAQQSQSGRRSSGLSSVYDVIAQDYLYADPSSILLFPSNHDTNRIADDFQGDPRRVMMAMTIIATVRGIPQIYYGDEWLARASKAERPGDGDKRVDFLGGWAGDQQNLFTADGRSAEQNLVFDYMSKLFNWRKTASVIHHGRTVHFRPVAQQAQRGQEQSIPPYIYFRYDDDAKVMVALNASESPVKIDWERIAQMTQDVKTGTDVITGSRVNVGAETFIPAMGSLVVEFK